MLQFIWMTMKHSEIFSSSPNLPNRRTSPQFPTLANMRHKQRTTNPWKVNRESRPTSQASNYAQGQTEIPYRKNVKPISFQLTRLKCTFQNYLEKSSIKWWISWYKPPGSKKHTRNLVVCLTADWGKGSFWTKWRVSLHLPRDHYNLPGPVMNTPLQGTSREQNTA